MVCVPVIFESRSAVSYVKYPSVPSVSRLVPRMRCWPARAYRRSRTDADFQRDGPPPDTDPPNEEQGRGRRNSWPASAGWIRTRAPRWFDPLLRAVIGQTRSSFDFREAMDERKLLCDLAKGAIGADNAMLLGSLSVMQEKLAALSRSDISESERVPHLLFAEEAQNFIGDFESILAESRKFNLILAVATQGIESLSPETAAAIFTNAANLIGFRVSSMDAEHLKDGRTRQRSHPGAVRYSRRGWDDHCHQRSSECAKWD